MQKTTITTTQARKKSAKVSSSKWLANKLSHLLALKKKIKSHGIIKMRKKSQQQQKQK